MRKKLSLIFMATFFGVFVTSADEYRRPYPQRNFRHGGKGGIKSDSRRSRPAEPPEELVNDSNLRRSEFSSRNGELKYCEFLENGDTEGPMSLVLLMHGLSNSGDDNLRQLAMPAIKPLLNYLRRHKIKAEIPGLITFRMDWLDLLAVQGTLMGNHMNLLQSPQPQEPFPA